MKVIGLMSGTSADGVDAALVEIEGKGTETRVKLIGFSFLPYPGDLRRAVLDLCDPEKGKVDNICRMNVVLGEWFAQGGVTGLSECWCRYRRCGFDWVPWTDDSPSSRNGDFVRNAGSGDVADRGFECGCRAHRGDHSIRFQVAGYGGRGRRCPRCAFGRLFPFSV